MIHNPKKVFQRGVDLNGIHHIGNPLIGEEKKGDLRGIYVHKFKVKSLQYLLSYRMIKSDMELLMIGPHEDYYKDLKSYLKRR